MERDWHPKLLEILKPYGVDADTINKNYTHHSYDNQPAIVVLGKIQLAALRYNDAEKNADRYLRILGERVKAEATLVVGGVGRNGANVLGAADRYAYWCRDLQGAREKLNELGQLYKMFQQMDERREDELYKMFRQMDERREDEVGNAFQRGVEEGRAAG